MAISLIDKIKPKNGGTFPLVDAEDVLMPDGKRLSENSTNGSQLPTVTENDNGSFAQVVNGAWAAVNATQQVAAVVDYRIASLFVPVTQDEYDALVAAGTMDTTKYYLIVG